MATMKLSHFEKVIGLCPGARHFTKRWPPERFARVGAACAQKLEAKILVFGGREDETICNQICWDINNQTGAERASSFCGKLGLLETAASMGYCDVVITNDTGLMHIATAMRRKIIAIFGSTVREFGFFPHDPDAVVLEHTGLDCRPCTHIGRSECPEKHFKCMLDIQPDEVYSRVKALLV
jgi:heptosyltransferase-2